MKAYCIFFIFVIALNIGCKKGTQEDGTGDKPPTEKKAIVITLAGQGTPDFANGPALSARFHYPEDVAVAADDAIYVADAANSRIRKLAAGQVSTLAGGGGFGIINGNGTLAQFKSPYSITSDAAGNLYTTDENDPRIRKISPSAEVSTYAGTETEGFADGNADTARFYPGNSIAADAQGNLYVADAENNRIRKVSTTGQVSTIAGNGLTGFHEGSGSTAQFFFPGGIALDKDGNLYVMDRGNFRIRKVTPGGDVSTLAGSGIQGSKDGSAGDAQFGINTHDVAVDGQGNLYLEDGDHIRKITPQGVVSTIGGSTTGYADGDGALAKFNYLAGMGIDLQGDIYLADLVNNRVRKISFE